MLRRRDHIAVDNVANSGIETDLESETNILINPKHKSFRDWKVLLLKTVIGKMSTWVELFKSCLALVIVL